MADEALPSEYDVIILGTGTTESILAAAFARVGYKVLHLDRNDYYSGDSATFYFKALREWIKNYNKPVLKASEEKGDLLEEEQLIPLEINGTNIEDVKEQTFIEEKLEPPRNDCGQLAVKSEESDNICKVNESDSEQEESSKQSTADICKQVPVSSHDDDLNTSVEKEEEKKEQLWTLEMLEDQWRKFNIDLMPKILYCRGSMVELLISSDVAKYCEFRTITRVLTIIDGKLQQVPCSRSDVFSSKQVSVIEKRMLMKFLTFAMEFENHPEEYEGYEQKPYVEFLQFKNLSSNVLHYVLHAIAMATEVTPTIEGLKKTQRFLRSLGRYGNTAFLWPLYGASDLLQCFCRMCAVFGGTYCLSMTAQSVVIDRENTVQAVINTQGQRLKTKWLVMESSYAAKQFKGGELQRKISRAVLLVDDTILHDKDEHITLLSLPPPDGGTSPTTVLELSSLSMACPNGLYVVHLTCETVTDAETDLMPAVHSLYNWKCDGKADSSKPSVLWSLFFNITDVTNDIKTNDLPRNLFVVRGPDGDLDFEHSIHEAKTLFESLCPDEEFLPRAPNPEDIVYDDGENASNKEMSSDGDSQTVEDLNNAENEAREAKQADDENSEIA